MAEKVAKVGLQKESGFLYFIDKNGDIGRAKMSRGSEKAKKTSEIIKKVGIKKEPGYLYFLDKDGDISCAKMSRGRKK